MRFDGHRYRDCRWCHGGGCLACEAEADAAYRRAFPEGPKPVATVDLTDPQDLEAARKALGPEAMTKAFGPGGGGVQELVANLATARSGG